MKDKKITIGLIGTGRIGRMHADNILANCPQAFLKIVVDIELDKEWIKSKNIPISSDDINSIIHDDEIDAVVIATPSDTHVKLIQLCANAGKHIFCEKPIAFDLESIQKAITSVQKAGVLFQVGFNRRFDPNIIKIKNSVNDGKIGIPHIINITSRDPIRPEIKFIPGSGGLFMDFCTHDFDIVRFITNSDVEEIYAKGANLVDPQIGELGDIDTALITLKLKNGTLCYIEVGRETNYGYDQQVEVFGSEGSIRSQNIRPTSVILSNKEGVSSDKLLYSFIERYKEAYINEIAEFIDCVMKNKKPSVTGDDVYKAVKIAIAAEQSLKSNQTIRLY